MNSKKQLMTIILTFLMIVSAVPFLALAEEGTAVTDDKETVTEDIAEDAATEEIKKEAAAEEADKKETAEKDDNSGSAQSPKEGTETPAEEKKDEEKKGEEDEIKEEADTEKKSEEKTEEKDAADSEPAMLIEGTEESKRDIKVLAKGTTDRSASSGSRLDPMKIKSISWKHDGWSYLISWENTNHVNASHKRKITSIKDTDGNEMLDDPNVTAGYAYCCEPGIKAPEDLHFGHTFSESDGNYTAKNGRTVQGEDQIIRVFDEASAEAAGEEYASMRKMLYYLPGGDGWKSTTKSWYTSFKNEHGLGKRGERGGITSEHMLAHLVLSLKWQRLDANEVPVNGGTSAKELVSKCDDETKALINKFTKVVTTQPDPPDDFLVFYVYTNNAQDLWGVFGELDNSGFVTMKKESGDKSITD